MQCGTVTQYHQLQSFRGHQVGGRTMDGWILLVWSELWYSYISAYPQQKFPLPPLLHHVQLNRKREREKTKVESLYQALIGQAHYHILQIYRKWFWHEFWGTSVEYLRPQNGTHSKTYQVINVSCILIWWHSCLYFLLNDQKLRRKLASVSNMDGFKIT